MASVITKTAHGFSVDDAFYFGNLVPSDAGPVEGQTYYVLTVPTADTFTFSDTIGGTPFDLTFDITDGIVNRLSTYTPITDPADVMAPPVPPATPNDPTVSSVVHQNTVVLRVTVPSAAEAPVRAYELQVTKAVPQTTTIEEVQSANGSAVVGVTDYELPTPPEDGNLIVLMTTASALPSGFTDGLGGARIGFAPGGGFLFGTKIASGETGSWTALHNGFYIIAEFTVASDSVLDFDVEDEHASNNTRMSAPTITPSFSGEVLVLGMVQRDNIGANSLTPDAGYTETDRYDNVANGWSLQMIHLAESNGGTYDPGTTPDSGFSGGWGYAAVALSAGELDPPDWDVAMESTLLETGVDLTFEVPVLGSTRYALRTRRQDVYGNYGDWSSVQFHTTTAGSDSLQSELAMDLDDHIVGAVHLAPTVGADDTILMADAAGTSGLKWVGSQTPVTQAFGDAAAEGTADTYARGDHKHGIPATSTIDHGALTGLSDDDHPQYATNAEFDDHSARHESGGADAIKLDDLAAPDDNTDLDVSTSKHGLAPKITGSDGDVLTKSGTAAVWSTPTGGGAPTGADYLVGTAQGGLSAEIVVGTSPGGELGGTWGSPTVDATHSGSAHTDFIAKTLADAKGDIFTATADNTPAVLTVGADDRILMADSAAATGLKWVAPGSPQAVSNAASDGTADTFSRGDHVHAHEAAHINHDTTWAAKGDLIVGTANDTAAVLTVGANDTIPMADSGETTGIKWVAAGTPAAIDATGGAGSADTFARGDHTHLHEAAHIAHDTIWAAAGDIVVATGNDAAAVLSKGNAGAVLAMLNGALAWNAGTSFPGSPATGDRYFRTDLRLEFFYDGTRWLSTELFTANSDMWTPNATYTVTLSASQAFAHRLTFLDTVTGGSDVWLEDVILWGFIASGGSALSASHKWVATVQKNALANTNSSLGTIAFDSGSSNTWRRGTLSVDALLAIPGTNTGLVIDWAKTGTPGNLTITNPAQASYRIVAT